MMGNHQCFRLWARFANQASCLQPIQVGHADINNNDVGIVLGSQLNCFSSGTRLCTYRPSRMLFDKHAKTFTNQVMVISDQDF
jgi:hypothetical protein